MARRLLSEAEGYELLRESGIPVPEYAIVQNEEDAAAFADSIGYPVVMKVISPQIVHKTDAGGVVLEIQSLQEALQAYRSIIDSVREYDPEAEIRGVMVEKQMPPGLELIVGGRTDPTFGKVLTFGLGGVFVELLRDIAMRVLPIDRDEAERMVREIRGYPLIAGFRGRSMDEEALIEQIQNIGNLFCNDPRIVEFDINPMILYEQGASAVDARIYREDGGAGVRERQEAMAFSPEVFYADSIAVVGASSDPRKIGYAVFRNLLNYPGRLYAVNPKRAEILGHRAYGSLDAIPGDLDMVVIAVPASAVPQVLEESGRKGAKLAVIVSAGFRETGERGRDMEERLLEVARTHGIRIVGPNSLGIMLPHQGINTTFDPVSAQPGYIGFVSQSGAIITTVVDWSITEGIGFSAVVSVGNQMDLSFLDYLKFLEQDENTRAIILYIEEIRNGREFMETVAEVSKKKPIIALKAGSSAKGKEAAISHTGSLAGSYDVYLAAFRQTGVIPAFSLREAFNMAEVIAAEGYPGGRRAVIVTGAGGFAVLGSDYAERFGIDLAALPPHMMEELNCVLPSTWSHANPLDIVGDAGADRYARVFDVLIRHQDLWDIGCIIAGPTSVLDPRLLAHEIERLHKRTDRMVVGCLLGGEHMKGGLRLLREKGIPNFTELEDAFKAIGRILSGMKLLGPPAREAPPPERAVAQEARAAAASEQE